jgi:lipoyl(octanoyl) transferase
MGFAAADPRSDAAAGPLLQAYLLGPVDFESALALQRYLVYQVGGDRTGGGALVLCEHPPLITVGRQGSRAHVLCEPEELRARRWSIRWVNRGGGCWLHLPGQLAVYPVLPLRQLGLGLNAHLERLQDVFRAVLEEFGVRGESGTGHPGVWVGGRPLAALGVAVRDWVSYYGAVLNVNPDLEPYRRVRCVGPGSGTMTSLERERRGRLSPALVRERLLEHFAERFGFGRTALFFEHPLLPRKGAAGAVATRP